ncbi:hypothetical protein [Pseudotamlana carrageenivorans]|uniref:DUF4168 domain-containing protein n=1 Tax=Pseudotamlana carrageenivorans TaxID=2069432 RepID=A0A2I7SHW3_9FLAO|nr:hypothetical protein [Tamlana carrageenivorans]AUS05478.1 hypothetical protein C1A40_08360 [Tamlana carrageenivorans]
MKKLLLTLTFAVFCISSYAQENYQDRLTNYFIRAATQEFDLNKRQQRKIANARTEMAETYMETAQRQKKFLITEDGKNERNLAANKKYYDALSDIIDRPFSEIQPFLNRMRIELKNVK